MDHIMQKISDIYEEKKNIIFAVLIVSFILVTTIVENPFYQDIIISTLFWATVATAWNLLGGFAGQTSLGHAAFFGIGAYTSTILYIKFGVSPWIGMLLGATISVLIAIIISYPTFRLTSHFFALATIAFNEVLQRVALFARGLTDGGVGLLIPFKPGIKYFMFDDKRIYLYIALFMMVSIIVIVNYLSKSRLGFYLVGLREDQSAAESLGVNTTRAKTVALIISVFYTSIAGTFYAQYYLFIDPTTVFSLNFSIQLALISIIGGMGTVFGSLLGSLFLTPLDVFLRGWLGGIASGLNHLVYGVILIIAVMYFPRGIHGWLSNTFQRHRHDDLDSVMPSEGKLPILGEYNLQSNSRTISNENFFIVKGLSKRFGGLVAVNNFSFNLREREILGIIGPNGAGKTTVFNLISGCIPPDSGQIQFLGKSLDKLKSPYNFCNIGIARTFQIVKPFAQMSVLENIMVGSFQKFRDPMEAKKEALRILELIDLKKKSNDLASSLTIAYRKRLELGRALATGPKLLLLDEVMAGLNPKETEDLIKIVKMISNKTNVTILMIEHVMKAVMDLCDRIIVINNGEKIAEGTAEQISKNELVIKAYLGEEYLAKSK